MAVFPPEGPLMTEHVPDPQAMPPWMLDLGFRLADRIRQGQGAWLEALGHGPVTTPAREIARAPGMRVLAYGPAPHGGSDAARTPVLIVPAPIKRHYIWDLEPEASVVARLLAAGLAVHLIEWLDEAEATGGLNDYAGRLIEMAVEAVARECPGPPVLLGHSLGGTLATIFAASHASLVAGLVLLEAPLCFGPGTGIFAAMLARDPTAPERLGAGPGPVPGSVLDAASIAAAPGTFVGEPFRDMLATRKHGASRATHMRVRRWAFDEFQMPARLFVDVVGGLYRDDLFARGLLVVNGQPVRPADLACPVLAVVDPASDLLPLAAVRPVLEAAPRCRARLVQHGGEVGVLFQHVGGLVGRRAHGQLWPEIISWIQQETAAAPPKATATPKAAPKPRRAKKAAALPPLPLLP